LLRRERAVKFSLAQASRKGGRPYNQDRVAVERSGEALLLAVADGMGGYAGGELAAQATVDCLCEAFAREARPVLVDPEAFLLRGIGRAHAAIAQAGLKARMKEPPRTTIVACAIQSGYAYWSFVGDSRLYLIRGGRVAARTRDHSVVQQLVDAGRMREEAVAAHPQRNQLLRCLGGLAAPAPEPAAAARLARGDVLLLCSDGLWGPLTPRRLLAEFIGREPASALARAMALAEAHAGADCDNVSAVALRWDEEAVLDLAV
jgi:serine/threonine protein phosphatase PrpC